MSAAGGEHAGHPEDAALRAELQAARDALRDREADVLRLEGELAETNRGVLALYAELDEKAEQLRLASDHKTRFLSNVSHELRTPLASVLNIAWLLLQRVDGPLTDEQTRQVTFIRSCVQSLTELVNELLDLAKIEAGKIEVHPAAFSADELMGTLRGTFRPLATNPDVTLVVESARHVAAMHTDEGRLSQILRNLLSNALKFTERGEVRLAARVDDDDTVSFSVRDSGIGIAPADHPRVFEEFAQVDSPLQRRTRGTGLGLPLSRRLAELLGGRLTLESAPGAGSTFTVTVPRVLPDPARDEPSAADATGAEGARA